MSPTINTNANPNSNPNPNPSVYLQDKTEVEKVFQRFDANNDGKISSDELAGVMKALGTPTSPEEISRMMSEIDSDKDGFINLTDFANFCKSETDPYDSSDGGIKELRDAFEMYDQNHNGLISAGELHQILTRLGDDCTLEDCEKMIKSVDADGDGSVNFDEFKKMMTNNKK